VGRGEQPITEVLNAFDFVGGSNKTNYAARPLYLLAAVTGRSSSSSHSPALTASSIFRNLTQHSPMAIKRLTSR
jgi:hypothetical protein